MKPYYTDFVEHCFRFAVRFDDASSSDFTSYKWHRITRAWLERQTAQDRAFIETLFSREYKTTLQALQTFTDTDAQTQATSRLAELEKAFAIAAELAHTS